MHFKSEEFNTEKPAMREEIKEQEPIHVAEAFNINDHSTHSKQLNTKQG